MTDGEKKMSRLQNKVAIVTGSTKGIGVTIASIFAAEGARVVVTGRSAPEGEAVVKEIEAAGGDAFFVQADQSKEEEVQNLVTATVAHFGRIDVLVNNAAPLEFMAGGGEKFIADQPTDDFDYIIKVALYGPWWTCKYAIPEMRKAGAGSIVNISSLAAVQALASTPSYSCAKGALNALTREIALDYSVDRIRSNVLVLGFIMSGSLAQATDAHPTIGKAFDAVTLTRRGKNEDVAYAALFLCSEEAEFINGVSLPIDGGLTARSAAPNVADLLGG